MGAARADALEGGERPVMGLEHPRGQATDDPIEIWKTTPPAFRRTRASTPLRMTGVERFGFRRARGAAFRTMCWNTTLRPLTELSVDAIWLAPIYPSPRHTMSYLP